MHRLNVGLLVALLAVPALATSASADQASVKDLWRQVAQARQWQLVGPWRQSNQWQDMKVRQLLQQVIKQAPADSVDSVRATMELHGNQFGQVDAESAAAREAVQNRVAQLIKTNPKKEGLVQMVGLVMGRRVANMSIKPVTPFYSLASEFLTKQLKAGGDDAPEAAYWLIFRFEGTRDFNKRKTMVNDLAKNYPNSKFGQWAKLQNLMLDRSPKSIENLVALADSAKGSPVGFLALTEAARRQGNTNTFRNRRNPRAQANALPLWIKAMKLYVRQAKEYPNVDVFPFSDRPLTEPFLYGYRSRFDGEVKELENLLAEYYTLNPNAGTYVVQSPLMQAYKATTPEAKVKVANRVFDAAIAKAKKEGKPQLALSKAWCLWQINPQVQGDAKHPMVDALNNILATYPKSSESAGAYDLLALVNSRAGNTKGAASYWNELVSKFPKHPVVPIVKFSLALLMENASAKIAKLQELTAPNNSDPLVQTLAEVELAKTFTKTEEISKALTSYQSALKNWPVSADNIGLAVYSFQLPQQNNRDNNPFVVDKRKIDTTVADWQPFAKGDFGDLVLWRRFKDEDNKEDKTKVLTELIKKYPKSPVYQEAHLLLAVEFEKQGEKESAIKTYTTVLESNPSPVEALMSRIGILRAGGNFDKEPAGLSEKQRAQALQWAKEMSSTNFQTRAKAARSLKDMGIAARPILLELAKGSDEEAAGRAKEILNSFKGSSLTKAMNLYKTESMKNAPKEDFVQSLAQLRALGWKQAFDMTAGKGPAQTGWCVLPAEINVTMTDGQQKAFEIYQELDFYNDAVFMNKKDRERFIAFTGLRPEVQRGGIGLRGAVPARMIAPPFPSKKLKPVHPVIKKYADEKLRGFFRLSQLYYQMGAAQTYLFGPAIMLPGINFNGEKEGEVQIQYNRGTQGGTWIYKKAGDKWEFVRQGPQWIA